LLDPVTLQLRSAHHIEAVRGPLTMGTSALLVDTEKRVYLADTARSAVLAFDPERGEMLGHWRLPLSGWLALTLSPSRKRLYVGNTTIAGNRNLGLDLGSRSLELPPVAENACSDEDGLIYGPSLITPDERFLLNSSGRVFRLP